MKTVLFEIPSILLGRVRAPPICATQHKNGPVGFYGDSLMQTKRNEAQNKTRATNSTEAILFCIQCRKRIVHTISTERKRFEVQHTAYLSFLRSPQANG